MKEEKKPEPVGELNVADIKTLINITKRHNFPMQHHKKMLLEKLKKLEA